MITASRALQHKSVDVDKTLHAASFLSCPFRFSILSSITLESWLLQPSRKHGFNKSYLFEYVYIHDTYISIWYIICIYTYEYRYMYINMFVYIHYTRTIELKATVASETGA